MNYIQRIPSILPAIALIIIFLSFSIPYGFPLGLPFVVCTLLFLIVSKRKVQINYNIELMIFYLAILSYLWGLLLNDNSLYINNIKDLKNILTIIFMSIILALLSKNEFKDFLLILLRLVSFTSFFVSIFALIKYQMLINGKELEFLIVGENKYPRGTSLIIDYNMFSYSLFFGIIASFIELKLTKNIYYKLFLVTNLIFLLITILLAGSRRAWVILILLFLITFIFSIKLIKKQLHKKSTIIFFVIIVGLVSLFSFRIISDTGTNREIERLKYRFSTIQEGGFSERTNRWIHAKNIYINEYTLSEKIFGSGFDYLMIFAEVNSFKIKEDYPHNPILSALLYSGILGFILSIVILLLPFVLINEMNRVYKYEMLTLYIISLMYILISGNSIFSNKLFLCYLLIILFSAVQHKRQKTLLIKL